jgi:protein NrfD
MNELTSTRSNPLIDPGLHIWHGEVPVYLFLGGLVAGIMVLMGLRLLLQPDSPRSRALSLLPWSAPVLLSLGMLFLWLDLANRFNAYRFYLVLRPASPMSWGSWILVLIYPASILLAWIASPGDVRGAVLRGLGRLPGSGRLLPRISAAADWPLERVRAIAAANIVMGAALGVYTGVLLGAMAARPLWNSAILGPLFLVSGISTGAAFMLLYRLEARERITLGRLDMGLIVAEISLIALWFIGLASGGAATREALGVFLGGPYTASFWTLVVALGLLTPLVTEWLEHRHGQVPGRLAAVLVLAGGFMLRWIVVFAGQHAGWIGDLALR